MTDTNVDVVHVLQAVHQHLDILQPYPDYKPSGINWLGDIPSHWASRRLHSTILSSVAGLWGEEPDESNEIDHIRCVRVADFDVARLRVSEHKATNRAIPKSQRGGRLLQHGDILLEKSGGGEAQPVGRVVMFGISELAVTSNFVSRLRLDHKIAHPKYVVYLMDHIQRIRVTIPSIKQTTGIQNLDERDYLANTVGLPPLEEQRAIANFLDAMDERITRFIDARQRMIVLLEEQKQAIINQAVTRGLDPDVPLKPSGSDWLGDIPVHWEVAPLRSTVANSVVGLWGDEPTDNNEPEHIRCIRVADFDIPTLSVNDAKATQRAIPQSARGQRLLVDGDILLEKSGGGDNQPVGRVVSYRGTEPAVTSNFVSRLRVNRFRAVSDFILALMDLLQRRRVTAFSIKQTTGIQNLNERDYLSNRVGIPPLDEQAAIVAYLASRTDEIEQVRIRHQREIKLIQEYRTRLISDVVTGQLDVRGAGPVFDKRSPSVVPEQPTHQVAEWM